MTAPDQSQLPDGWPATAYIDGWIATGLAGYYYDRFFETGIEYDPKVIAEDMLEVYERFNNGLFAPRAVLVEFAKTASDLRDFEDRSWILSVDKKLTPAQRAEIERSYPNVDVLECEDLTTQVIRNLVEQNIAISVRGTPAVGCRSIEVLVAEFEDLSLATHRQQDNRPPIHLNDLESGFHLEINTNGRPLEVFVSILVKRGQYGIDGLAGTRRLQATIAGILETMPAFEMDREFQPVPPDHWSLIHYSSND